MSDETDLLLLIGLDMRDKTPKEDKRREEMGGGCCMELETKRSEADGGDDVLRRRLRIETGLMSVRNS